MNTIELILFCGKIILLNHIFRLLINRYSLSLMLSCCNTSSEDS